MINLTVLLRRASLVAVLASSTLLFGQKKHVESFNATNNTLVRVNTSHTNVVFETWNKDKIEVEAFIDGDDLTKEEKQKIFDNWDFKALGNSKEVVITSNSGSLWGGVESLGSLEALKSLEGLKDLESLKGLEGLESLKSLENFKFNFNFDVPDIPDFKDFPNWPFSDEQPGIRSKDGGMNFNFDSKGGHQFDSREYEKNKQAYVNKLNKKYGTKVSVREVDDWLDDVDDWAEGFSEVMEEWGDNFGKQMELKFGPEFELKMEKWGEEFGKDMEEWGDKFGKEMEKWGETYGKEMEKWAEQFEKDAEKWAEKFEGNGNHNIIINRSSNNGLFDGNGKVKKTIIIRMPKGTKTDINVKYGDVKMADAYNIKAKLDYSALTANSIDGGGSLIDASYAPVYVNSWLDGDLRLKYVEDCRLNNVGDLQLDANSSNVTINALNDSAILTGSYGMLLINNVSDRFNSIDIVLENTDANVTLPNTAFEFYYNGKKSTIKYPRSLTVSKTDSHNNVLVKGFNVVNSSSKSININAKYSNVKIQ